MVVSEVVVMPDRVIVYADAEGLWRWHRKGGNGEIVSESGEGYVTRSYAHWKAGELNPEVELEIREEED